MARTKRLWITANWLFDKGTAVFGLVPATVVGASMTALASLGSALPPVVWGAIGLGAGLATYIGVALGLLLLAKQRVADEQARHAERINSASSINPLDARFDGVKIRLSDFEHPYGAPITGKVFTNCEIVGPAVVTAQNTTFAKCSFLDGTEFIKSSGEFFLFTRTKMLFIDSHFINCRFFDMLFIVSPSGVDALVKGINGQVVFVGDAPPNHPAARMLPPSRLDTEQERPR